MFIVKICHYSHTPPPPPPPPPPPLLTTDAVAVGDAAYGPGEGRILLRTVICNGSESALLSCPYSTPSPFSFFCRSHNRDASVVCQGKLLFILAFIIYKRRDHTCVKIRYWTDAYLTGKNWYILVYPFVKTWNPCNPSVLMICITKPKTSPV